MIVVALSTALTGILLLALGLTRAGGAIRFIPYPVIGGFLSATGWLMVNGAVRVITDHGLSPSTFKVLVSAATLGQLAAASAVALSLYVAPRTKPASTASRSAHRHRPCAHRFRAHRNEP